jgi:hypothetical protein
VLPFQVRKQIARDTFEFADHKNIAASAKYFRRERGVRAAYYDTFSAPAKFVRQLKHSCSLRYFSGDTDESRFAIEIDGTNMFVAN